MKTPDERREYMRQYMAKRRLDPVHVEKNRQASYKWRAANREKGNALAKAWRDRNPDRVKELNRQWHAANVGHRAEYNRDYYRRAKRSMHLNKKFGLTEDQYDTMLIAQNNHCATCLEPDRSNKRLAVDHCHKTGKIRGLLCANCNRGIGLFEDDPELMQKAIDYLKRSKVDSE